MVKLAYLRSRALDNSPGFRCSQLFIGCLSNAHASYDESHVDYSTEFRASLSELSTTWEHALNSH